MDLMNLLKVCQNHINIYYYVFIRGKYYFYSCNDITLISGVNYAVKDITEGAEYEFRVSAINESGSGDPSPPSEMVWAKNPNSK